MISVFFTSCPEKDEHVTARLLLEEKVDALIGSHRETLTCEKNGRPFLKHGGDVSVSHSHGTVAVAVACERPAESLPGKGESSVVFADSTAGHIGVDIETLGDKTPEKCRNISERFFFPEEKERLKIVSGDGFIKEFVIMWTKKEALFKTGANEYSSPLSVNTEIIPENAVLLSEIRSVSGKECAVCLCMIQ